MKIKHLFLLLCLMSSVMGYAQGFETLPRMAMPRDCEVQEAATRATGDYLWREFPTLGEVRAAVILVAFADVPFSVNADSINGLLSKRYNADSYTEEVDINEYSNAYAQQLSMKVTIPGSARDYFRDQSFGLFVPTFDVIGPVTLDNNRAYYGANNSSGRDVNVPGMISDACRKVYSQGLSDFTDYDNDGDGVVDIVYVVYAGCDEAQTDAGLIPTPDAVWAKASSISLTLENGMKIKRYACSGELLLDLPVVAGIGTFVHEFSHILGLPDFYNTLDGANTKLSMDVWSVMDYGMYNAQGFVPCAYTAFERYSLGWLPMTTLEAPATMSLGTTDEEGTGYRVFVAEDAVAHADTASFYLMETIRREGWNSYAYAEGLLISQVTYKASEWRNNTVNTEAAYRHYMVPANNHWSIVNGYKPGKHLYGTANHEFTLTSVPSSVTQAGAAMNKPLTDINYDAETGRTTFHFRGGDGMKAVAADKERAVTYDLLGRPVQGTAEGVVIRNGRKWF